MKKLLEKRQDLIDHGSPMVASMTIWLPLVIAITILGVIVDLLTPIDYNAVTRLLMYGCFGWYVAAYVEERQRAIRLAQRVADSAFPELPPRQTSRGV